MEAFARNTCIVYFILVCALSSFAYPEKGKWTFDVSEKVTYVGVSKSLSADSKIFISVQCKSSNAKIRVSWILRHSPCWEQHVEMNEIEPNNDLLKQYYQAPSSISLIYNYSAVENAKADDVIDCNDQAVQLQEFKKTMELHNKRAVKSEYPQYTVKKDGVYILVVQIKPIPSGQAVDNLTYTGHLSIEMKSNGGYLSVADWPLLPFYATMCALYALLGFIWVLICLCRWRDILRIQMWIGGVLFLGMLEMAVYVAEYDSLNATGELTKAAEYAAELLSCAKRSLSRILVLIVSMGFGFIKPRLGPMLQRIIGVGVFYMIISSVEAYMKLIQPKNISSRELYVATLLLALLDAAISLWIFTSLVQTIRTLRLRRNTVKLALYHHFTNTLIFSVVASVIFMTWSIYFHQMGSCLTDWKEIWLDEAFWKLLFSLILVVIMFLWRPTNNNQRYAFTPFLDSGDEEEDELVINDNLEGVIMRNTRGSASSPSPRGRDTGNNSIEDELKWVEENIPSSVVESGLPLLDSEEEIMTARFELSKMQ